MDGVDDEWDESFLDELIRAHDEAVASRNPNPTPAPAPAHFDPFATAAVSYLPAAASHPPSSSAALPLSNIAAAPHASASAARFSPPRELTQRPPPAGSDILALVPAVGRGFSPPRELTQRPAAEESDCEIVGVAGPAGGDRFRGGAMRREWDAREAERREVERLKKELNRVSKQMNDLKNECNELKKDRTKKDLEIKAKEAEIQKLKKANVKDICSMGMNIDQSFHTPANGALPAGGSCWTSTRRAEKSNGKNKELRSSHDGLCFNERPQTDASEVLELKHRTMTDSRTDTSGEVSVEESAHLESKSASGKCKEIKTIRVQTDLPLNSEHLERKKVMLERISSNLCAIWGMPTNSLLGRNLISNILVSCSEEILQLLRSVRLPDGTSSEVSSSMNNDISEVYDIIIKMNSDTIPIQTLLEALLNLCAVGNAVVVGSALRMLHSILQHLLNYGAKSSQSVTSGTMFVLSHMLTIAWTWREAIMNVVLLC